MDKKILLIADDEVMNRRVIHRFLKDTFEVLEADEGEKALEILKNQHVDLLLLDIVMPGMDGLEVLKQMQETGILDKVGVLVATSMKEKTERTALSLGADDVVSKPYDPIVIKKRLQNILAVKDMQHQIDMLLAGHYQDILEKKEKNDAEQLISLAKQIKSTADLIEENRENAGLIWAFAQDVKNQSKQLVELLEGKN